MALNKLRANVEDYAVRSEGGADCRALSQKHSGEEDNRNREHNLQ
jgi:hypothetical protein